MEDVPLGLQFLRPKQEAVWETVNHPAKELVAFLQSPVTFIVLGLFSHSLVSLA